MGWKCQYTDIPENPFRYPKAHISQLAQLPSFLSPSPSTSSLLQGSWWWLVVCASWWGRFQSFGFAVHVCVSAVCYLSVSLLPVLCRSPGVPGSGCESVQCGGGRDALQRSVRGSTDPACPAALLTHLAFPAAFPWLPRNTCLLPAGHSHCKTAEFKYWDVSLPNSCAPYHIKISSSVKTLLSAFILFIFSLPC